MSDPTSDPTSERQSADDERQPLLRILTPDATAEEVAAVVAVFAAMASVSAEPAGPPRPPAWNAAARLVRRTHRHGPDGWRLSGLPR